MRLSPLLLLALATCCPPAASKPKVVVVPPDGAGSGSAAMVPTELSLASLQVGTSVHGFTPTAIYLDASDQPVGARLVHDKTKFIFDYLRIESAPQAFIWVNSFPTSDMGEPHTQEHLLLGKGDRGRKMGSFQAMMLAESSAFTDQWRTAYHFHTVAGRDAFWPVFADQIGAMLDADYTDEEIRREVRNFGVDKGDDGKLRLEEKGTVYNEMVRYYEQPDTTLWLAAKRLVYGTKHPLAYESGGYPDDIRRMTPQDIRTFHGDNYHLANMGMIAAFPSSMTLTAVLDGADKVLTTANQRTGKVTTEADLPKPAAASTETPITVDYPYSDTTQPSPMVLAWPATRGDLDLTERTLLGLFLSAFAGDESTPLYKKLIDSKSRTMDLGASGLDASMSDDQGNPIYLFINGVRTDKLEPETLAKVRAEVMAELARIAKLPDGDPELAAIKKRIETRAIDLKRQLAKFLDSPPGFGFRGASSAWMNHMDRLAKVSGTRRSLTLRPELAAIDKILAGGGNPWRTRVTTWGLLAEPFVAAAKPSTKLRKDLDAARDARIAAELARLGSEYKTKGKAATLAKYQVDYDKQTKLLDEASAATPLPPLVASPPMTYDELRYTTSAIGGVPMFQASIDSMQSARVALAFSIRGVDEADQMYLALLPSLLEQVGIADGKNVIKSEDMTERLRTEILALSVHYDEDLRTNRAELVVAGAGNDVGETKLALGWMRRVMLAPDWRLDNLPRLRDVVDQALTGMRSAMQGSEESWVRDPHDAWWRQDSSLHLHTNSFLTQAHDLHRLRWQLLDPLDAKVTAEVGVFLSKLSEAKGLPRAQLVQLAAALVDAKVKAPARAASYVAAAAKLSPQGMALAVAAGKDLTVLLADLPDGSLGADWAYLCKQMAADLKFGAPAALAKLAAVRAQVIVKGGARITTVGATKSHTALAADLAALIGALPEGGAPRPGVELGRLAQPISDRMKDHDRAAGPITYVGLFSPATSSGVFINNAPATSLQETSQDAILDYLTSNIFSGHGAHSLFMKTWAAGLAYSNGAHPLVRMGQFEYYAERCPLLPQTMRFVVDQLKAAKPDPNHARYAIAKAFDSRIAAGYEERAMALADDLVDGVTPEIVTAFRKAVLAQTDRADLTAELFKRLPAVYGKVLPGYGTPAKSGAINFVIGPAKQLDAYQAYLRSTVDKAAVVHRLYPRDFWTPAKL